MGFGLGADGEDLIKFLFCREVGLIENPLLFGENFGGRRRQNVFVNRGLRSVKAIDGFLRDVSEVAMSSKVKAGPFTLKRLINVDLMAVFRLGSSILETQKQFLVSIVNVSVPSAIEIFNWACLHTEYGIK